MADVSSTESIVFKYNRLYRHNLMRINYTTYDVHRAQDTINVNTVKRDVMVLPREDLGNSDLAISFTHARVLGIFHVNAVHIGAGLSSYLPVRLEFLWVQWFQQECQGSWERHELERLSFPPMAKEESFGFLDLSEVIRSCHLLPVFSIGKRYADGRGLSPSARDSDDFHQYYVGR